MMLDGMKQFEGVMGENNEMKTILYMYKWSKLNVIKGV